MTIEQKLEKRINSIIELTGEYPKGLKVTQEEYNKLKQELKVNELLKFRNIKIIVIN